MPHDRHEARTGGFDWLKRYPNYHITWSLRGGKMRWPWILVFWTTRVLAMEIHGIREEKQDQGPQSLSNLIKENRRMSSCNRLDLQTLGSQPIMPKNLPDHWSLLVGHQKQKSLRRCCSSQCMPLVWWLHTYFDDLADTTQLAFIACTTKLHVGRLASA